MVFCVTHFYSSPEVRETLNTPALDEIVATNTLPSILNRDMQGRLRRKLTVLKLEKWISRYILNFLDLSNEHMIDGDYTVDMSTKNPRWVPMVDRVANFTPAQPAFDFSGQGKG